MGPFEELLETAYANLRNYLLESDSTYPLSRSAFESMVDRAKKRLTDLLPQFSQLVTNILQARQSLLLSRKAYPGMHQDLTNLLPNRFLEVIPFSRLESIPKYLKAMQIRSDRAALNPVKDQERSRQLVPYTQKLTRLRAKKDLDREQVRALEELRWLLEEYKVSLFAQELGTAHPVSPKRLEKFLEEKGLKL